MPWIDGNFVPTDHKLPVTNPATGSAITQVHLGDHQLTENAIKSAAVAQKEWESTSPLQRGACLKAVAKHLKDHIDRLAGLLTAEQGKPLAQARGEVEYAASFFEWFGEEARRLSGRISPHPERSREFHILPTALGVAGLITPWNFPLAQGAKKAAAALAAGCSIVWKPSEFTPLVALAMGRIFQECGLPDGVCQIIPGIGSEVGESITSSEKISIISLTGSTETGRRVMENSSRTLKHMSLELGGNAPFIVLPDAELDKTAEDLLSLKLLVSGQVCVTANRVFVHEDLLDNFVDLLSTKLETKMIGDGSDPSNHAGPVIHDDAKEGINRLVNDALSKGAEIAAQNSNFEDDPRCESGSFSPFIIMTGITPEMRIANEEIFGPVIAIQTFKETKEVISSANSTPYGLAAYVYGGDLAQASHVARSIDAGIIGVNEWRPLKAEIPFGGSKQSGIGVEGGAEGIQEFMELKVISIPV